MAILLGFAIWFGLAALMVLYYERTSDDHGGWLFGLTYFVGGPFSFVLAGALLRVLGY